MGLGKHGCTLSRIRYATVMAVAVMVAVVLCVFAMFVPAYADEPSAAPSSNHYNVVFVADTSGSMASTDPNGLRFEAISRFLALLSDTGNRVGAEVFSTNSVYEHELTELNGASAKKDFINNIKKVPEQGWTNIGEGLSKAVNMLDTGGNPDNPSIIVLLTDGNTELGSDDAKQQSLDLKAQSIESARNKGYKIYTVSLNADGNANSQELSQIASATGGQFKEVKQASDLNDVFDLYYQLVFPTQTDNGKDIVIPQSGSVEGTFDVASIGVEEANVLITGKPTDYTLTNPSGKAFDKTALASSTFVSDAFVSTKITDPAAGTWKYSIKGVPGDHVRIDIVRNTDISAKLSTADGKSEGDAHTAGDQLQVTVQLLESGKPISAADYAGFTAKLEIKDAKGASSSADMDEGADGLTGTVPLNEKGTITVSASVSGHGYDLQTNTLTFNVDNSVPTKNNDLEQTVKIWPFVSNTATVDLTPGASDKQDSTLTYTVDSSAFDKDDYSIDGSKLVIDNFSLSQGSFTIRATDSDGASCTFNVLIKTVNIGLLALIGIGAGVLIALIVIGLLLWIALNKRFYGECFVREFDETNAYHEEVQRKKIRGRIALTAFGVNLHGIDPKARIQASGKDYATLEIKKKAYVNGALQKSVKLNGNGIEVRVSGDKNGRSGVIVRFKSQRVKRGF